MPAIVSHLVGTLAIAAFAATMTFYMYLITGTEKLALTKAQLKVISGSMAARVVELISLANESNTQSYIQSTLEIPLTVLNSGYWISITSSGGTYVSASTVVSPVVTADSIIPVNSPTVNVRVVSTEGLPLEGFTVRERLYGGTEGALIWARRVGNVIEIGLGVRV
jgi:hypothetical protein